MELKMLQGSIAYCGLACGLCDHNGDCQCKAPLKQEDKCDKAFCPHRACCLKKQHDGCWECDVFPCDKGRFADENRGQTLAFVEYIKEFGKERFINKLLSNQEKGILYGMSGAYRHKTYEEVRRKLRSEEAEQGNRGLY